jgi:hypothetical protein
MGRYLITYHGSQMPSDPAVMEKAKQAFGQWLESAGRAVVDPGAPTRAVTQVAKADPTPTVDIGGYSVIEASSIEEARTLLRSHPFVARGGTLQVHQCLTP